MDEAIQRICGNPQVRWLRQSSYHSTNAIGGPDGQQAFLNAALLVETTLGPAALLEWTQKIEKEMGRERLVRWGPRRIDIDILLFGTAEVRSPPLEIPHPRMTCRPFVLLPAVEIAPQMEHRPTGWTIAKLVQHLQESPKLLAVVGMPGRGAAEIVQRAAGSCGARRLSDHADPAMIWAAVDCHSDWMEGQLESLRCRCQQLDQAATDHSAPNFVISDFWVSQTLALSRTRLHQAEQTVFAKRYQAATRQLPLPRLRVLIDGTPQQAIDGLTAAGLALTEADVRRLESYQQNLRQIVRAPLQGPLLDLTGADSDAAVVEIMAAVDAMKEM
jgi:2-amino-4-hydroxy-6-hydroxymethyldihydropteridine diphosphokinase